MLALHEMMRNDLVSAGPTVLYVETKGDANATSNYSFTNMNVPSPGLLIVLVSSINNNRNITSLDVDGVAGTVAEFYSGADRGVVGICSFPITTAGTKTVNISFDSSVKGVIISTYMMTNYTNSTPVATSVGNVAWGTSVSNATHTAPANSYTFVVGSVRKNDGGISFTSGIVVTDNVTTTQVNETAQIVGHYNGVMTNHVETITYPIAHDSAIALATYV